MFAKFLYFFGLLSFARSVCYTDKNPVNLPLSQMHEKVWYVQEVGPLYVDQACSKITISINEDGQTGMLNSTSYQLVDVIKGWMTMGTFTIAEYTTVEYTSHIQALKPGVYMVSPVSFPQFDNTTMRVIYYQQDDAIVWDDCYDCDDNPQKFLLIATKDRNVTEEKLTKIKKEACIYQVEGLPQLSRIDQEKCDD